MKFALSPAQWLASICICFLALVAGSQDPSRLYAESQPKPVAIPLVPVGGLRPVSSDSSSAAQVKATSVYILAQENGEVLFEHNSNTDYAPASTTKLMTALVVRQQYQLDTVIAIPSVSFVDARQPLVAGQKYTVRELLATLLISSNNTAAYALAQAHPEGYEGFMRDMNRTARVVGLTNSYFTNPAGFDAPDHRSTARDLGLLFRAALQDPVLREDLATVSHVLRNSDGNAVATFSNTHQLLKLDSRAKAGKTGTTDEARQVLITLLETKGHPYILVLLGSTDRYNETRRLADWVDERYTWQTVNPDFLLQDKQITIQP